MKWKMCGTLIAVLALAGGVFAKEEGDQGKGKGKDEAKPNLVQIDLSKLPPDVVKLLMKLAAVTPEAKKSTPAPTGKPAAAPTGKPAAAPAGKFSATNLPPGLAKKPKDHPGRVNFIKNHSPAPTKAAPAAPEKKTDKKKKDKKGDE